MIKRILVDLDSIIDTRLPIYRRSGDGDINKILALGYLERKKEGLGIIKGEDFRKQYSERDKSLLTDTDVTGIIHFLNDLILEASLASSQSIIPFKMELLINIHPYLIDDSEKGFLLRNINEHIEADINIRLIDDDPAIHNFEYLNENNIETFIVFDFIEYFVNLKMNEEKLDKPTHEVKVFSAYTSLENPELPYEEIEGISLSDTVSLMLMSFMAVEFLPMPLFSISVLPPESHPD